jgi:hypothetical protein
MHVADQDQVDRLDAPPKRAQADLGAFATVEQNQPTAVAQQRAG